MLVPVNPDMKYGIQDIACLEKIQKRATRLVRGLEKIASL